MNTVQRTAQWQRFVCRLCLLVTALFMITACGRSVASEQPAVASVPSPMGASPTVDIYETYGDKHLIEQAEAVLQTPELSQESRQLIEDGLTYQKQQAERRATAVARGQLETRAGDPDYVTPVRPTGYPTTTPGITTMDMDEPHPFSRVIAANVWHDYDGDTEITVQAGGRANDLDQGVVAVLSSSVKYGGIAMEDMVDTPTRSGSVRIIAEQNWQLTLEAENGDLFVFDVEAREFVDDPPAPTPTGDPDATPTATVTPETAE